MIDAELDENLSLNFDDYQSKMKVSKGTQILNFTNKKVQVTYSLN